MKTRTYPHTAGEWLSECGQVVRHNGDGSTDVIASRYSRRRFDADGNDVSATTGFRDGAISPVEADSNCQVLAASSEMLRALELVNGMLDVFPGFDSAAYPFSDSETGSIGQVVRAAIEKAIGER